MARRVFVSARNCSGFTADKDRLGLRGPLEQSWIMGLSCRFWWVTAFGFSQIGLVGFPAEPRNLSTPAPLIVHPPSSSDLAVHTSRAPATCNCKAVCMRFTSATRSRGIRPDQKKGTSRGARARRPSLVGCTGNCHVEQRHAYAT
jgi:hypothetical protein